MSDMAELRWRQVHLDFHTSPLIPDVGERFEPEEFAQTLSDAYVDSITVFSKCHHGLSYHPTSIGRMHPSLKRDLLGEMIEACHARNIRTPIYISVVWDETAAAEHPEWQQMDSNGRIAGRGPLENGSGWRWLCLNSPYLEYVVRQTEEVLDRYAIDGVFFDIVFQLEPGCFCQFCLTGMQEAGVDVEDEKAVAAYSLEVVRRAMKLLSDTVWVRHPEATIFFNGRCRLEEEVESGLRPELQYITHIEIESLPSGGWGYTHFQTFARHYQTFDRELLGMTARFHNSWSDFGTLKNRAALEYEVFTMLANGAKASIGDQLHPRGVLDRAAYQLIGDVYGSVQQKKPWCAYARPVRDIAVYLTNSSSPDGATPIHGKGWYHLEATTEVLLQEKCQFQIVDAKTDLHSYALVIFPDIVRFDRPLRDKVQQYIAGGGRVLLTFASGLWKDRDAFALDEIGATIEGQVPEARGEYFEDVAYLRLGPQLGQGLPDMEYVVYHPGIRVRLTGGEPLGQVVEPYFQRRWNSFSGHKQTPADRPTGQPIAVRSGGILYVCYPLFGQYRRHGNRVYRAVIANAIELLAGRPLVEADVPSTAQVTLLEQDERYVLHVLHYPRERRCDIDIIEDVIPLYNVPVSVRLPMGTGRVYLAPQEQDVPFQSEDGRVAFVIPAVIGHQMVVIDKR